MRKNIFRNLTDLLHSRMLLLIPVSLMATSCIVYTGGYSETDGVYYDPNRDTLPQGSMSDKRNRVGEYYDYQDSLAMENTYPAQVYRSGKYKGWNEEDQYTDSDWGTYAGSEVNVYNNFSGRYSFYPGFGFGGYYGLSYGWGLPFSGMFYDPFWDYPFYSFGYSPYNWYYGGFYNPYFGNGGYGYGNGYYNNYYRNALPYKRSGNVGGFMRSSTNNQGFVRSRDNEGFRTVRSGNTMNRTNNVNVSSGNGDNGQRRIFRNDSGNNSQYRPNSQGRTPVYRSEPRNNSNIRSGSSGGFRSPSSSGSVRSGTTSSSSSSRSGGFRR